MLKKLIASLSLLTVFVVLPASVSAQTQPAFEPLDQACQGQAATSEVCTSGTGQVDNPIGGRNGVIVKAANLISVAVGVATIILVIIGGITIALNGADPGGSGKPSGIQRGRDTILYALIGLVITLVARSIIVFVINRI